MNNVVLNRSDFMYSRISSGKFIERVKKAIAFSYSFFDIQTSHTLFLKFGDLPLHTRGNFGYHTTYGVDLVINISKVVSMNNLSLENIIFHEMTHFKQFIHDQIDLKNISYYKNGRFDVEQYANDHLEIEAREMENIMAYSFNRFFNNYKTIQPVFEMRR